MDKEKVIKHVKQYSDLVRQNFRVKRLFYMGLMLKDRQEKTAILMLP